MFAQACEPFLIHPTAAFFDSADIVFISVFIHVSYGIGGIMASSTSFFLSGTHQKEQEYFYTNNKSHVMLNSEKFTVVLI